MVDGLRSIESSTSETEAMTSAPCYDCDRTSLPFPSLPHPLNSFILSLSLSQDVALVRSYRELSRRIAKEGESSGQKCSVEYWGGAWEVEKYLLESSK